MPEINNIFIDDPKRLREPIKALEVKLIVPFGLARNRNHNNRRETADSDI